MAASLAEAVDKLRHSSARLNQLTDEASTIVKKVEDFLNEECSAGIFASVAILAPSLDKPDVASPYLEYRRFGQRYRIAVVSKSLFDDPESESVKSWSECPRDEKLRAIKKLPELIMEVAKELDEKIIDAEKTMATVSQVLRTLPRKKKKISRVPITPPQRVLSVPPTLKQKKED